MENFAELMQRLLEIQIGGRQRSPELIAEDERLMDRLQKRNPAGRLPQTAAHTILVARNMTPPWAGPDEENGGRPGHLSQP